MLLSPSPLNRLKFICPICEVGMWQSQDPNPGSLTPESCYLTIMPLTLSFYLEAMWSSHFVNLYIIRMLFFLLGHTFLASLKPVFSFCINHSWIMFKLRGRAQWQFSFFLRNLMGLGLYFTCVNWYWISGSSRLSVSPQCHADSAKQWVINCLLFRLLCFKNAVIHLHPTISVSLSMISDNVCNLVRWKSLPGVKIHIVTQLCKSLIAFSNTPAQTKLNRTECNTVWFHSIFVEC